MAPVLTKLTAGYCRVRTVGDEAQSELDVLRARVYGRSGADLDDVTRLRELEQGAASGVATWLPEGEAAQTPSPPVVTAPPPAASAALAVPRGHERRVILIATVSVVAVGSFVAGLVAGGGREIEERATAATTQERSGPLAVAFPEELTPSFLRVATRWNWDPETLRFAASVDGAAIWVGTLGDLSEVCLVFDETTSATILCNPTGDYPSSFDWVKATDPSPGTYRLSLEPTGELEWTFEPTM